MIACYNYHLFLSFLLPTSRNESTKNSGYIFSVSFSVRDSLVHTKCRPSVANISLPGALAAPRCGLLVGWLAGRCSARRARPPGPLLLLLMLLLLLLTRRAIGDTNSPAKAAAPRVEINPLLRGDSVELDGGEKCRRRRRRRYLTCISLAHDTPHAARKLASSTALPNERTNERRSRTNKQTRWLAGGSLDSARRRLTWTQI